MSVNRRNLVVVTSEVIPATGGKTVKLRHKTLDSYASQPGGLAESISAKPGISVDATPHAEQERPHQLDFMRAIISNLGEGTYAVNRTGQVTFMNPAAERML